MCEHSESSESFSSFFNKQSSTLTSTYTNYIKDKCFRDWPAVRGGEVEAGEEETGRGRWRQEEVEAREVEVKLLVPQGGVKLGGDTPHSWSLDQLPLIQGAVMSLKAATNIHYRRRRRSYKEEQRRNMRKCGVAGVSFESAVWLPRQRLSTRTSNCKFFKLF